MSDILSGSNLMWLFIIALSGGWWFISWLMRPAIKLSIPAYDLITEADGQRAIQRIAIEQPSGPIPLRAGMNDFYLVIKKGELLNYPSSCFYLINPILRDSEEVLFFRVHALVVGDRLKQLEVTNLTKTNVRLIWCKVT